MTDAVELIIMRGLPGCGKSYTARNLMTASPGRYKRVSKDLLRAMLDFGEYSAENESTVRQMRDLLIMNLLADDHSVIVDDTNLNPEHELQMRFVAKQAHPNVNVNFYDLTDISLSTCIERDSGRPESVGAEVIRSMAEKYLAGDGNAQS